MANDLNHVTIIGNIVRTCGEDGKSFGYTQSGICIATISIASNRSRKQGTNYVDDVSYFEVNIWGKTAENLKQYLTKGTKIAVDGILKQERWTDQQGNNKSKVVINAMSIQLLGNRNNQDSQSPNNYQQNNNHQKPNNYQQNNNYQYDYGVADFPDDIPF